MLRTIEEVSGELRQVNAAIIAVATGAQSYTIGSRSVTKANLTELRKLKNDLLSELAEIENGGSSSVSMGWIGR